MSCRSVGAWRRRLLLRLSVCHWRGTCEQIPWVVSGEDLVQAPCPHGGQPRTAHVTDQTSETARPGSPFFFVAPGDGGFLPPPGIGGGPFFLLPPGDGGGAFLPPAGIAGGPFFLDAIGGGPVSKFRGW